MRRLLSIMYRCLLSTNLGKIFAVTHVVINFYLTTLPKKQQRSKTCVGPMEATTQCAQELRDPFAVAVLNVSDTVRPTNSQEAFTIVLA